MKNQSILSIASVIAKTAPKFGLAGLITSAAMLSRLGLSCLQLIKWNNEKHPQVTKYKFILFLYDIFKLNFELVNDQHIYWRCEL